MAYEVNFHISIYPVQFVVKRVCTIIMLWKLIRGSGFDLLVVVVKHFLSSANEHANALVNLGCFMNGEIIFESYPI